jgi:16S rRNA (cytosine967-C5)-methyltransferase
VSSPVERRRRNRGRPQRRERARTTPTQARHLALRVLERVEKTGAYANLALHGELGRCRLAQTDRALATELVYGTLRWRGRLDFLLSHVLDRELAKLEPTVRCVLRLGAYQLVMTDRIPASAAVDESVRCIRAAGAERAAGLVNAVLRRLADEADRIALPTLEEDPTGHLCHTLSLPRWIAESWIQRHGPEEAAALARASNELPPGTVRVNRLRTDRDTLLAELQERYPEVRACDLAPDGIRLGRHGDPSREPAFLDGRFTVQDEASQLVVELLDPQPGDRVLDTCAAPGAKASAIAERVGESGFVLAADRHERRLELAARDARRLGLSRLETRVADATRDLSILGAADFDRILVDAPCSGIGTLRHNPDLRWRVGPDVPARLAETQLQLLRRASTLLGPTGTLVYSTCTLTSEENEAVIEAFLEAEPGFRLTPPGDLPLRLARVLDSVGRMRCWPHRNDTDGFFAARLERVS